MFIKKIISLLIIVFSIVITSGCETKSLYVRPSELLDVSKFNIGDLGTEVYIDLCSTGEYSYYIIVDVEISSETYELRKYHFINKTDLDYIEILEENRSEYVSKCNTNQNEIFNNNPHLNKFFTDEGYIIKVNEYDIWNPDLILYEEYNLNQDLINGYKNGELNKSIEALFREKFFMILDDIYITYNYTESYGEMHMNIYNFKNYEEIKEKDSTFEYDNSGFSPMFQLIHTPIMNSYSKLKFIYIFIDSGELIILTQSLTNSPTRFGGEALNEDRIISIEEKANESFGGLYYIRIISD